MAARDCLCSSQEAEAMINTVRKGEWLELHGVRLAADWSRQDLEPYIVIPEKLFAKWTTEKSIIYHGNRLRLHMFPQETTEIMAEWMDLEIIYEDDFCLVVYKPAGIPVHSDQESSKGTLANGLAAYYEATNQACRIRHIHRLDEDTSGPVLYAKNEFAHLELDRQMRQKEIGRGYIAVAEGIVNPPSGQIAAPIGRDRHHNTRRRVSQTGDSAVTHYQTRKVLTDHTLLELQLETGRTHQIRVHLRHLGYPLAGDILYGGSDKFIKRQALHGESLWFGHPLLKDSIRITVPSPDDFKALVDILE